MTSILKVVRALVFQTNEYRKVASSRQVYYSIFNHWITEDTVEQFKQANPCHLHNIASAPAFKFSLEVLVRVRTSYESNWVQIKHINVSYFEGKEGS